MNIAKGLTKNNYFLNGLNCFGEEIWLEKDYYKEQIKTIKDWAKDSLNSGAIFEIRSY